MDKEFWFSKKSKQFLKNIDTFYYSIFLEEDMTRISDSHAVYKLRAFCDSLKSVTDDKPVTFGEHTVIYQTGRFSVYNYRFSSPDFFDFFVAPVVNTNDTPAFVMQLRSRSLWEDGVYSAYHASFSFVQAFCKKFGLHIREVKENRCDFACHSNYLQDPERFFDRDHFVKMWVGRVGRTKEHTKHYMTHITVYDDDSTETDYIAIGSRGSKCFIRIYLKTKEVIQEGYKGFFLKLWQLSGLISRYDLWCLEEAYKRKSWAYLDFARLEWLLENDEDLCLEIRYEITAALNAEKPDINLIHKLAKKYTMPVTKIFNVEFQCMRDMSKSFQLLPRNNDGCVDQRVLDYLDNYSLIYDYLTTESFRLVRPDQNDSNRARCEDCEFWKRLKAAKTVDFKRKHKDRKLIRKYSSNVSLEMRKKRAMNALSSFGYAVNHNSKTIMSDAELFLSMLNDNDIEAISKHKKKLQMRNTEDIPDEQKRFRSVYFLYDPENEQFYD